jgi:hypothetical protein
MPKGIKKAKTSMLLTRAMGVFFLPVFLPDGYPDSPDPVMLKPNPRAHTYGFKFQNL